MALGRYVSGAAILCVAMLGCGGGQSVEDLAGAVIVEDEPALEQPVAVDAAGACAAIEAMQAEANAAAADGWVGEDWLRPTADNELYNRCASSGEDAWGLVLSSVTSIADEDGAVELLFDVVYAGPAGVERVSTLTMRGSSYYGGQEVGEMVVAELDGDGPPELFVVLYEHEEGQSPRENHAYAVGAGSVRLEDYLEVEEHELVRSIGDFDDDGIADFTHVTFIGHTFDCGVGSAWQLEFPVPVFGTGDGYYDPEDVRGAVQLSTWCAESRAEMPTDEYPEMHVRDVVCAVELGEDAAPFLNAMDEYCVATETDEELCAAVCEVAVTLRAWAESPYR